MQKEGLELYGMRSPEALLSRPSIELYDLMSDPHEIINLSGKPEFREVQEAMISKLKRFQKETRDPLAEKWINE